MDSLVEKIKAFARARDAARVLEDELTDEAAAKALEQINAAAEISNGMIPQKLKKLAPANNEDRARWARDVQALARERLKDLETESLARQAEKGKQPRTKPIELTHVHLTMRDPRVGSNKFAEQSVIAVYRRAGKAAFVQLRGAPAHLTAEAERHRGTLTKHDVKVAEAETAARALQAIANKFVAMKQGD